MRVDLRVFRVLALAAAVGCGHGGQGVVDASAGPTDAVVGPDTVAEVAGGDTACVIDIAVGGTCAEALPLDARQLSLDGVWTAVEALRSPGGAWSADKSLGEVTVPGWLFPFERFPSKDQDVRLVLTRAVYWPSAWSCATEAAGYRGVLELDSADYAAVVRLDGEQLGTHTGYLGRFGLVVPFGASGTLEIELMDGVRNVDAYGGMEAFPHVTIQGADTGGWGVNPVGLPRGVRLRLVRDLYLRGLYAAAIERVGEKTRVRVGLAVDRAGTPGAVTADVRVSGGAGVLLEETVDVELDARGEAAFELSVEGLPDVPVGSGEEATVDLSLRSGGEVSDSRSVPLVNRRVALEGDSLIVNGVRHFARGAAVHHQYRLLPFGGDPVPGTWVALDASLEERYDAKLIEATQGGVQWLRAAHLLPDDSFLRGARKRGLLVYQDFPLLWNTDFGALPQAEIEARFRELLWTVAAEPAVAVVAAHNEAELGETDAAEVEQNRKLLDSLIDIAHEVAPHLVVVGCSGCKATSKFGGKGGAVEDVISDAHSYFGSWWQPSDGYRDIPDLVAGLATSTLPALWSEMGNGWTRHYVYLSAVTDDLEPAAPKELVALRAELEGWLKAPNGTPLTLRQFYGAVYCSHDLGVPLAELVACVGEQLATHTDAQLIAWARGHFMGDRPAVEGPPADPIAGGVLVAAHWLAAQIFESRWQWAQGTGMLGVISWERPENAYPFAPDEAALVPQSAVKRSQEILATANAPVAAALRVVGGGIEVRVVNDEGARTLSLRLISGGAELWKASQAVEGQGGASVVIPAAALAGHEGELVELAVSDGAVVAGAALVYEPVGP